MMGWVPVREAVGARVAAGERWRGGLGGGGRVVVVVVEEGVLEDIGCGVERGDVGFGSGLVRCGSDEREGVIYVEGSVREGEGGFRLLGVC